MRALTNLRKDRIMAKADVTADDVRQYLSYYPATGHLVWKISFRANIAGERAGGLHKKTGYWRVGVLGKKYQAHHVAWLLHYGEWPEAALDHINGDRADNRISNLRSASQLVNTQNRRNATPGSKSGLIGAHWHSGSGMWNAKIRANGRRIHIGMFATAEEAHAAYVQAKRLLHEGNTL